MPRPAPKLGCVFYRTDGGDEPVRAWLRGLGDDVCTTIGKDILKVQWRWPVSRPLVGSFGDGLYEVRASHDGAIYRVFFCIEGSTMVLLHGFMKKTQATPKREIDLARARARSLRSMKKHIGSSFESFLEERGIKNDARLRAQKEILAEQIREAMDRKGVSSSALASMMGTSRTVVHRLLDPAYTGVTLATLSRVARALDLGLTVSFVRPARTGLRKTG